MAQIIGVCIIANIYHTGLNVILNKLESSLLILTKSRKEDAVSHLDFIEIELEYIKGGQKNGFAIA